MKWSLQQDQALCDVRAWLRGGGTQVFRLFGYAGTGKTTLAQEIGDCLGGNILFGAFTGKAALVMRQKGCRDASTIHSLIYHVDEVEITDKKGRKKLVPVFSLNENSKVAEASLVVIDECSMVNESLGRDLLSFNTPVLVIGDPAQLPPVQGAGFFTDAKPDVLLTEVHRQALDNPIIAMSMAVREGRPLRRGRYGESRIIRVAGVDDVRAADQVLVGLNRTRRIVNDRVRELDGRNPDRPEVGDKLVCLHNNRRAGLLNGSLWRVESEPILEGVEYIMDIVSEDDGRLVEVSVPHEFFEGLEHDLPCKYPYEFTYGYGLTVHKAQGSQWDNVIMFDESRWFKDHSIRHLYTGITRAAEQITIAQRAPRRRT